MLMDETLRDAAGARLTIDLMALVDNYRAIARRVAPAAVAAVVKADAYGLGARVVSRALEAAGCADFFVATLGEAIDLKPALGAASRVLVLNGLQPGAERVCAAAGAIPVINALEQAWRWRDLTLELGHALPVALQVDSGMSRLGLSPDEVEVLAGDELFLAQAPPILVMSHLACADEPENGYNRTQAIQFAKLADALPPAPRSLANSGAAFLDPSFHGDLVRAGVCLYGAAPNAARPNPMKPVVRLEARVVQIRQIPAGQGVGYGLTYTPTAPTAIATISLGYADGWPRALSNIGAAYYQGVRLPIAGRVSMDSITLDISALAKTGLALRLGDAVELLGAHQTLEDVAEQAGTIAYEILTGLRHRYHRTYVESSLAQDRLAAPKPVGAGR
ncbi:alanine racemase [Caulobacter sp. AP07]|uniref:alanine racemase n=1 Tax=Caulobacter sp. AP07 TaxID=1144304 RepID=UPI0002720727|nr:alanine racemase [Caulobacter sp. AP07]EJL27306.1 alanine racemase [Caulobacter sp. AP07]